MQLKRIYHNQQLQMFNNGIKRFNMVCCQVTQQGHSCIYFTSFMQPMCIGSLETLDQITL